MPHPLPQNPASLPQAVCPFYKDFPDYLCAQSCRKFSLFCLTRAGGEDVAPFWFETLSPEKCWQPHLTVDS